MAAKTPLNRLIVGASLVTMMVVLAYFIVRLTLYVISDYAWYERLIAGILLISESFLLLHSFGYFLNVLHVAKSGDRLAPGHHPPLEKLKEFPPVAIIVSSYKEPLHVIENTLTCFYNLAYPNKYLYFLDDTRYDLPKQDPVAMQAYRKSVDDLCAGLGINVFRRRWHGAKAGMINDFLQFADGHPPEGFEFTPHMGRPAEGGEKYVMIFDADMNPFPDTVEHLVKLMEANPQMAFIHKRRNITLTSNSTALREPRACNRQSSMSISVKAKACRTRCFAAAPMLCSAAPHSRMSGDSMKLPLQRTSPHRCGFI